MKPLLLAGISVTLWSAAAFAGAKAVDVPIDLHEGHVFVRVRVGDSGPLWFLVDSGAAAPVNLLDREAAKRLGLPVSGEQSAGAIGGTARVEFTPPVALQIGSIRIPAAKLGVMAFGDQAAGDGSPVAGILGYPFFAALNPEIDYPRGRMRLSAAPKLDEAKDWVPFDLVAKGCRIPVELTLRPDEPPVPAVLIVDTGYDGSLVLNTQFVERHDLLASATGTISGQSLGGATAGGTMHIPSVRIGAHQMRQVATRLSIDQEGAFAASEVDGYVGSGLLKRYSVHFDYAHKRLVLRATGETGR